MKILIAPDKFKGSLSAQEVCEALSRGIQKNYPKVEIVSKPMADGGDGSLMEEFLVIDGYNKVACWIQSLPCWYPESAQEGAALDGL